MLIYGFSHSVACFMFPCVAWSFITDKANKPDLLLLTRRPFRSMDIALSREVNRQGQRNRSIPRLGKRELKFLPLFTCNYVVSVRRSLLFLLELRMGCVTILLHPLAFHTIILLTGIDVYTDISVSGK